MGPDSVTFSGQDRSGVGCLAFVDAWQHCGNGKSAAATGVGILLALCSALLEKNLKGGMAELRTSDIGTLLSRDFCVTDDLNGQTRVDGISPDNMEIWLPRVVESVGFYDQLVASFPPAEILGTL